MKKQLCRAVEWCLEHPGRTFAVVAFFMTFDNFILGPFSYLKWHDLGDSHFPHYVQMAQTINEFGLHYWYPYAGGGVDNMAAGYRFIEIFLLALVVIPGWLAISLMHFTQVFIAGWFTYRICKDQLGFSNGASLAGGLFYGFLQFNLLEAYFGLGALPFLIWTLERLHQSRGLRVWGLAAALGVGFSFLAPLHLTLPYLVPGIFAWLFFVRRLRDMRLVLLMTAFTVFSSVLQVDLLMAMILNAPLSQRANWDLNNAFFDGSFLGRLEYFWAYFHLFLLSVAAAYLKRRGDRSPLWLLGVVVAIYAVVLAGIPLRRMLEASIPLLHGFTLARFSDLLPFFLSIGAAWGLHELSQSVKDSTRKIVFGGVIAVSALNPLSDVSNNLRNWVKWGSYTSIFHSPDIERIADEYRAAKEPFRVVSTQENGLQAAFANAYGLETADGYLNIYPESYKQFWGTAIAPFLSRNKDAHSYFYNHGNRIGLKTDDGHSLHLKVEDYFRVNLLSLANVRYILTTIPLTSPELELLEETRPERFWDELSTKEKIQIRLKENFTGRRVMVYRNTSVLRRWFLSGNIAFYGDQKELKEKLAGASMDSLANTALFKKSDADAFKNLNLSGATGTIEQELYTPDRIRLKVSAKGDLALVLSNTYSPFWRVMVDGKETKILPAYGTFWGVPLKSGEHMVEFTYEPPYRFY